MWPLTGKEIFEAITKKKSAISSLNELVFEGICTDSRKIKSHEIFIAIEGENFDGHAYLKNCFEKGISLAVVNKNSAYLQKLTPEQRGKCIEVEDPLYSFRDLAKYMRKRFSFPVIGVGGSNGKTTTKEMLASLLGGGNYKVTKTEKSENGFLGMAITLCQEAHNIKAPPDALVLEIGIDDIGAMEQHVSLGEPNVSLLTALGPEHLEKLKNWETSAKEELILFHQLNTSRVWQLSDDKILHDFNNFFKESENKFYSPSILKNDFVVIEKCDLDNGKVNKDFILQYVLKVITWQVISSLSSQTDIKLEVFSQEEQLYSNEDIIFKVPLPGKHNSANFALSFATALMLERTPKEMFLGWKSFSAPPMRSRVTTLKNGAILFDDSYNSSPKSLEAALDALENKEWKKKEKLVVLGDMLDLGSESKYWHEQLINALKKLQNTYLCLYGSAMYDCYKLLKETEDTLIDENKIRLFWLAADKEPSWFLNCIDVNLSEFVILVKGSRGMKLDRLVKAIEGKYC